jgi:hypothetical protein
VTHSIKRITYSIIGGIMRLDNRRFLAMLIAATTSVLASACSSRGTREADTAGSAPPSSAQPDTSRTAPSGAVGDTAAVRADSVVLRTDKTRYRAGEAMTLTLENRSASSYAFNPCTRAVEREENGRWAVVPEPGRMCTMEAWILEPRGTRAGPTELPTPLSPGRYRVVVRMTREPPGGGEGSAVLAVSEPITVS